MSFVPFATKTWLACVFLGILLVIQYHFLAVSTTPLHFAPKLEASPLVEWEYVPSRDAENPALSSDQCDKAFPKLYHEIDRAVAYWKGRSYKIGPADFNIEDREDGDMASTVMIHDNNLILTNGGLAGRRGRATLSMLYRALQGATAAGETLPTVEFTMTQEDRSKVSGTWNETTTVFGAARDTSSEIHQRMWVLPDFNWFADPPQASGFLEMRRRAAERDAPLVAKIAKVFWRGHMWTNRPVREGLLAAAAGKSWGDVAGIDEIDGHRHPDQMKNEDMCRYMFTAYTEGGSWSGRLKYQLNCNSVPIVHELQWHTFYHHLLVPDGPEQNHISVARDYSDLEERIVPYLEDPASAQRIADNAVAQFRDRYTSPAAEACYWRRLIRGYAEVSFTPDPYVKVTSNVSGIEFQSTEIRGQPFEVAIL